MTVTPLAPNIQGMALRNQANDAGKVSPACRHREDDRQLLWSRGMVCTPVGLLRGL